MVNRESWYNGDYAKKYRFSLSVRAARKSLREAIKLCSRECSQGRDPLPWEEKAMLAYFWTLEWKLSDLGYTSADIADLKRRALDEGSRADLINEIKSKYALSSPATFSEMPEDGKAGFPYEGELDLTSGQKIWEQSCLHCHGAEGASEHYFGDKQDTWETLARKFNNSSKKSVYGFIRLGTHPEEGKRPYMPNYTKERLSDKQIEELRAYIESKAEGKPEEESKEKAPPVKDEATPGEKNPDEAAPPEEKAGDEGAEPAPEKDSTPEVKSTPNVRADAGDPSAPEAN